jgi:hypothetical protein
MMDNFSPWTEAQQILVDKGVPIFGSKTPMTLVKREGDVATGEIIASMPYVPDTWLKGTWYLTGSLEDESGIGEIKVEGDIVGSLANNPDLVYTRYPTRRGFSVQL